MTITITVNITITIRGKGHKHNHSLVYEAPRPLTPNHTESINLKGLRPQTHPYADQEPDDRGRQEACCSSSKQHMGGCQY